MWNIIPYYALDVYLFLNLTADYTHIYLLSSDIVFSYGTDHILQAYIYFHWPGFFKKGNVIYFVPSVFTLSYTVIIILHL